jgi:hypothetical protein
VEGAAVGDRAGWRDVLVRLVAGEIKGVVAKPLVVGDPYFYRGQTPIVVSEWGGFGWSGSGGPEGLRARAHLIRAFKRELRRRGIAGDVYTQATSVEDELNGVIDPVSAELLVPEGMLRSDDDSPAGTEEVGEA